MDPENNSMSYDESMDMEDYPEMGPITETQAVVLTKEPVAIPCTGSETIVLRHLALEGTKRTAIYMTIIDEEEQEIKTLVATLSENVPQHACEIPITETSTFHCEGDEKVHAIFTVEYHPEDMDDMEDFEGMEEDDEEEDDGDFEEVPPQPVVETKKIEPKKEEKKPQPPKKVAEEKKEVKKEQPKKEAKKEEKKPQPKKEAKKEEKKPQPKKEEPKKAENNKKKNKKNKNKK